MRASRSATPQATEVLRQPCQQVAVRRRGRASRARHVLVKTKAEAAKVRALLAADNTDANWKKVAKQYSIDPGSKDSGGTSGIFRQGPHGQAVRRRQPSRSRSTRSRGRSRRSTAGTSSRSPRRRRAALRPSPRPRTPSSSSSSTRSRRLPGTPGSSRRSRTPASCAPQGASIPPC